MPHLLIIGGSDAGIEAALRGRQLHPWTDVTVLVADRYPNFSICGIPYHVSGEVPDWRDLAHRRIEDLEATGLRLLLDHHAEHIAATDAGGAGQRSPPFGHRPGVATGAWSGIAGTEMAAGRRYRRCGVPGSLVGNVVADLAFRRPLVSPRTRAPSPLFARGTWPETRRIADVLRRETVGGALLLAATVVAMIWANSAWADGYTGLRDVTVGPSALHLDLTLGEWAADGLLAIFFFVAGLELKREFVAGDLRDPRRAALPITAAIGGMIVPAAIFVLINRDTGDGALAGWAIPIATDIAFALAVLAVISRHLPTALRTFLLTLAVVDDLLAITVIAVFFTTDLQLVPLLVALVPLVAFTVLVQRQVRSWWLLLPLAAATWALVHASGVHATVAGVLLGFTVPVVRTRRSVGLPTGAGLAEQFEHRWRPISAGFAVPVFAFLSAGVTIDGLTGLGTALRDPIAVGVIAGLVAGKAVGILAAAYLVARFTRARLDHDLGWADVLGIGLLGGIGFTVSLLIGELAYGLGTERDDHVKIAVLTGSLLAATLASVVLALRNRAYRRIHDAETADSDSDGIPDTYQPKR